MENLEDDESNLTSIDISYSESTEKSCESGEVNTERESLEFNVKQLIMEINSKRKRDSILLSDYKKTLDSWAAESSEAVENAVHGVCDAANKVLDKKLQELYSVIEDIAKLEEELASFRSALTRLVQDSQSVLI